MVDRLLESRPLGETGLTITRLGYGAMEVRGQRIWGGRPVTDEQAGTILEAVVDAGDHDETPHSWDRNHLLTNIDDSLAKLRTDHVDLLQLHNPDVRSSEEHRVVDTLREIKDSGKAHHIGISSTSPDLATYIEWDVFEAFQIPYSALERRHENLITAAHRAGAGTIVRGGVARGEPGAGLGSRDMWALWQRAKLDELLGDGESRTTWQLRFTLSHPAVDTIIAGTLNPIHLAENVAAAQAGPLPDDVYAEAKRRLDDAGESSQP